MVAITTTPVEPVVTAFDGTEVLILTGMVLSPIALVIFVVLLRGYSLDFKLWLPPERKRLFKRKSGTQESSKGEE